MFSNVPVADSNTPEARAESVPAFLLETGSSGPDKGNLALCGRFSNCLKSFIFLKSAGIMRD
jgi:hypothetical protein